MQNTRWRFERLSLWEAELIGTVSFVSFLPVAACLCRPARQQAGGEWRETVGGSSVVGTQHQFISTHTFKKKQKKNPSCQKTLSLVLFAEMYSVFSLYCAPAHVLSLLWVLSQGARRAPYGSQRLKCAAVVWHRAFEGTGADSTPWNHSVSR